MCLCECLQCVLHFSSLKGDGAHADQTVVFFGVELQCLFEEIVGDVHPAHLAAADAQQLQNLWILIGNSELGRDTSGPPSGDRLLGRILGLSCKF